MSKVFDVKICKWALYCKFVIYFITCNVIFFLFKQKAAYDMRISDWISDVCSSDLPCRSGVHVGHAAELRDQLLGAGSCIRQHGQSRLLGDYAADRKSVV